MNLDEAQMARVREWIDQGLKVADVQTRLADELGIRLTYMEARFLLDDLKLRPKDAQRPAPPTGPLAGGALSGPGKPAGGPAADADKSLSSVAAKGTAATGGGKVAVTVDEIARPGALASGKVAFSDGQGAEWQMDQYGRLAVVPKQQGYKPSQADVVAFQGELDSVLARLGY